MKFFGRLASIVALLGVVVLTPATPAAAVIHARTCHEVAGSAATGWYGVNICIKLEYLPGGVRALLAFDCNLVLLNPYRVVDAACNYELKELWVLDGTVIRKELGYAHITGKGYHQFATAWLKCNENKTGDYRAAVANANVRFPNGQLHPTKDLWSMPTATISCA